MFWDKGYAPSANIEALLEKENSTVEEFLDEEDILQECKTPKKNLVNYFTRPDVIRRLVELITTEPSEDVPMAQRFRYANMACEVLTIGLPSLDEKLLSDAETLQLLYSYLEKEPPLNPLLSSFFSKTFSMLFTKKPEQDWFLYQQMCLHLLEYIKSQKNFLDLICKHFDTPVIPDLIMQMMKDIDGGKLKRNLYEWLTEDKIVERLIAILRNPQETDKHANVADFFCDLIKQGRLMRQTEEEKDSFEPAFNGSNPILATIESERTIEALLDVILEPNAQESAILSGISVVLTLIKPITFTDELNLDRQIYFEIREEKFHSVVKETLITVIAPRIHEFVHVLKNPPAKPNLETTATVLSPPFGKTRLQICRMFTALLKVKHEMIDKAICATDYFNLLLDFFKEFCWNNFLHSELEETMGLIFSSTLLNSEEDWLDYTIKALDVLTKSRFEDKKEESEQTPTEKANINESEAAPTQENHNANEATSEAADQPVDEPKETSEVVDTTPKPIETEDFPKPTPKGPTETQRFLIVNCQLMSKLVNYWQHNTEVQSTENGRRLGYMGHLIKIIEHIVKCISEFEHIAALIITSFANESELQLWQSLFDAEKGEFRLALSQQQKLLANYNPHEDDEYDPGDTKDFLNEPTWDIESCSNVCYSDLDNTQDIVFTMDNDQFHFGSNLHDYDDDDDDEQGGGGGDNHGHGMITKNSTTLNNLATDPWDMDVQFADISGLPTDVNAINTGTVSWGADFNSDNFADFDAHFGTFSSDLGMPHTQPPSSETVQSTEAPTTNCDDNHQTLNEGDVPMTAASNQQQQSPNNSTTLVEQQADYDNNANVEHASSDKLNDLNVLTTSATTAAAATSIVSRLQSVLLAGEDDYEDDEGMWTKPLGGSSQSAMATDQQAVPLSNGPSKTNEFNHANDNNSSSDASDDSNITVEPEQLEQQKKAESIAGATANNAEIATTTT